MIGAGVFLVIVGLFATATTSGMPGAKATGPSPLGRRLVFIFFGAVMVVWGIARLIVR